MCDDLTLMRAIAVFKQINALPRTQRQLPVHHGDRQVGGQQRGLDMGGHVVGAFVGMCQIGHRRVRAGWHKPRKIVLQVSLNLGVGIFLNDQTGRGMADKQRQQTCSLHPSGNIGREFIKAGAGCRDVKAGLHGGIMEQPPGAAQPG